MKSLVIAGLLLASSAAYGQGCFSPGGCQDDVYVGPVAPSIPVGPAELCLGVSGCFPVAYRVDGGFMLAESVLPSGYPTLGWAGPCFGPMNTCPDIGNQAHSDLRLNALRIHRGLRFGH